MSKFRQSIATFIVLCLLLTPLSTYAGAGEYAQEVAFVKSLLLAENKDLSGSCGAFQITGRVAYKLKDKGFKLFRKQGGNRAIILPDGSCVDGDHGSGPGYATDYLISVSEGFVGYDLLGDGGGQNAPQWNGPENGNDIIQRNAANMAEPFSMGGDVVVPAPSPVPAPPPVVPVPVPVPAPSGEVVSLLQQIINLQQSQFDAIIRVEQTALDTNVHVKNMDRTLTQTLGSVMSFVGKYVAPALGGWYAAHLMKNQPKAAGQ